MKTKFAYILILSIISLPAFSQKTVKANIKVSGNCFMCKQRIETALDQPGIKSAQWNVETKNLEVVYNSNKISEDKIHQIVAAAGHDTDKQKTTDEVYSKLPFCCLYRDHDHGDIKDEDEHAGHHE
jgi:periplasmic mercuric ion binding protein